MFALQLLLAVLLRQALSRHHGAPGLLGELLSGGLHHGRGQKIELGSPYGFQCMNETVGTESSGSVSTPAWW